MPDISSQRRVVVAGGVQKERTKTNGRVSVAGCVEPKRSKAGGSVLAAVCKAKEGAITFRGVVVWIASVRCGGGGCACAVGASPKQATIEATRNIGVAFF